MLFKRALTTAIRASSRPLVEVKFTENAGRGVFATHLIPSGTLIHSEMATLTHQSLTNIDKVCSLCLRRLGKGTNLIRFCSEECAAQAKGYSELESSQHWAEFYEYCRENNLRFPLLVKRLACMVATNTAPPDVLDILFPPSPPGGIIQRWIDERKMLGKALADSGLQTAALKFLSDSWYAGVLCKIHLNTFRVETLDPTDLRTALVESVTGDNAVGSAVYILPSMFNHSCGANVNISWTDNAVARLESLRTIEAGEELYITYIDANMSCDSRRALLQEAYGFHCTCPRCLDGD